jgi:hypothetical protein
MRVNYRLVRVIVFFAAMGLLSPVFARKASEQMIYVPVYSEVTYGDRGARLALAATLSVRNLDRNQAIRVTRIDYFNSSGKLVRHLLSEDGQDIGPMAAAEFVLKESDKTGGISASFLVEWVSATTVQAPLVEAVMVNSEYNKGLAFVERGKILEERK